jgi:hypothetical protein
MRDHQEERPKRLAWMVPVIAHDSMTIKPSNLSHGCNDTLQDTKKQCVKDAVCRLNFTDSTEHDSPFKRFLYISKS